MDHNFSGAVDFEEFLSLVEKKISRIKRDERIIRLFRVFDRDRNGYITSLELRLANSQTLRSHLLPIYCIICDANLACTSLGLP